MEEQDSRQATPDEIEQRVDLVYKLLCAGWSQSAIVSWCHRTQSWGVSKRWLREYVHRARAAQAQEAGTIDRRSEFTMALKRYTNIYRRAEKAGDLKLALTAQEKVVNLLNLASQPPLKVSWRDELTQLGKDPKQLFDRILAEVESGNVGA